MAVKTIYHRRKESIRSLVENAYSGSLKTHSKAGGGDEGTSVSENGNAGTGLGFNGATEFDSQYASYQEAAQNYGKDTAPAEIGPLGPSGTFNPSQTELYDALSDYANTTGTANAFSGQVEDPVDAFLEQQAMNKLNAMVNIAIDVGFYNVKSIDYNYKTEIATIEKEAEFLGIGLGFNTDKHYNAKGEFGTFDEISADFLEALNIEVTPLNTNVVTGLASLALGIFMGASSITLALSAISVGANVAQLNGVLSEEENNSIQAATAFIGLGISTMSFMQQTAALASMSSYMTTSGKIMAATVTAINAYGLYNQFNKIAEKYGVDVSTISASELHGFDSSLEAGGDGGDTVNALVVYENFMRWYVLTKIDIGEPGQQLDSEDFFLKMAGGILYNSMFAGGLYYHPMNNSSSSRASVMLNESIDQYAMLMLQGGDDYFFKKNQMVSTKSEETNSNNIVNTVKKAKINQIATLQEQVNALIDDYETKVSEYNNSSDSNKTQETYDKISAELDTLNADITTLNEKITSIANSI